MRRVRGTGTAALLIAAALLVGCSGGEGVGGAEPEPSAPSTHRTAAPSDASRTPEPDASRASPSPLGPKERLDARADREGWEVGDVYASPSDYVRDVCDTARDLDENARWSRGQWLSEVRRPDADEEAVLRAGLPTMCPRWSDTLVNALNGVYERRYPEGGFAVGEPRAGESGVIAPGTYRAKAGPEGCRRQRLGSSGEVLESRSAKPSQEVTVTVRATDGRFTSQGCGVWKPVE